MSRGEIVSEGRVPRLMLKLTQRYDVDTVKAKLARWSQQEESEPLHDLYFICRAVSAKSGAYAGLVGQNDAQVDGDLPCLRQFSGEAVDSDRGLQMIGTHDHLLRNRHRVSRLHGRSCWRGQTV
jgi:hypothetical protein